MVRVELCDGDERLFDKYRACGNCAYPKPNPRDDTMPCLGCFNVVIDSMMCGVLPQQDQQGGLAILRYKTPVAYFAPGVWKLWEVL